MLRAAKPKSAKTPKLTDAERHTRFVAMGKEVGASDRPEDFDKAFTAVVRPLPKGRQSPDGA
jgi:hypothetical protein